MATPKKAPEDHLRRGRKPTGRRSLPVKGTTAPPDITEAIDRAGGIRKVIQEWYEGRGRVEK